MPTPAGHALGALLLTAPIRARYKLLGTGTALAAAGAGMAPDLDLLIGRHSAETHSVGAAVVSAVIVWMVVRRRTAPRGASRPGPVALIAGVAVASHMLLDWLGTDSSAPIGIMALWPFSREYVESSAHVFMAVSRRYWLDEFWTYNAMVLARELLLLGLPALAVEWFIRRKRP